MDRTDRKWKNVKLSVILLLLMGAVLTIVFWEPGSQSQNLPEKLFVVPISDQVDRIILSGPGIRNELVKEEEGWTLNNKWKADPDMMTLFFEVLDRNRVQRQVASSLREQVDSLLSRSGMEVSIFRNGEEVLSFQIGGNMEENRTYARALSQDITYELNIPGYNYFIGRVFSFTGNQWRDRRIFTSSWRSLKRLTVEYPGKTEDGFSIVYSMDHLAIEGVSDLDTLKMMTYLELFSSLRVVEFLEEEDYPKYESQKELPFLYGVRIRDIDSARNNEIKVFPKPKAQSLFLGEVKGGELALFDPKLVEQLVRTKEFFRNEGVLE